MCPWQQNGLERNIWRNFIDQFFCAEDEKSLVDGKGSDEIPF
jgi:hypothetical protein